MARKVIDVTITDEGRDIGKRFRITEMPASKGERWAIQAMLALSKTGAEIPDEVMEGGMASLAQVGVALFVKLPPEDAFPLIDELFSCVTILPNKNDSSVTRNLVEEDIEEISTRIKLKFETLKLHLDFLQADAQ